MHLTQAIDQFFHFLKSELHVSPHTLKNYAIDLKQFLAFLQKNTYPVHDVSKLDRKDIRDFLFSIKDVTASTRSRKLSTIRSLFDFLFQRKRIPKNIAQFVSHPKKPKLLPKPVRIDTIYDFLRKLPDWHHKTESRNYMVFLLLFGCGLRISELQALKVAHVSSDFMWLRAFGKGSKERDIPLPQRLADHLKHYIQILGLKSKDTLFPGKQGQPLTTRTLQRIIGQIAKVHMEEHGHFTPHQLRHSFATHLLANGANLRGIQELLGHDHLTSTEIYTHIHMDRLLEVVEKCHPASNKPLDKKDKG